MYHGSGKNETAAAGVTRNDPGKELPVDNKIMTGIT